MLPRPKAPVDLIPFFTPFVAEMESLQGRKEAMFWDGKERRTRVHLLFLTADMVPRAKLTATKGTNAIAPCLH